MKKQLLIIALILSAATLFAQVPQKMSYQAVVRNDLGQLITNQNVGIQISILQGSESGTEVYSEIINTTTNANGLLSIQIGGGAGFDAIDWAAGPYFIKTETDPEGGNNYTITGASELLSVPYALYSANGTPGPAGVDGVGIESTVDNMDGTFTINYTDASSFTTSDLTGPQGLAGTDGVGIESTVDNMDGTFTINYTDGSSFITADFTGADGVGIESTVDNMDGTFTINFTDASSFTTSDLTGPQGPAGPIAGNDTEIIFNNSGIAGASANLTWNNATNTLTTLGTTVSNNAQITSLGGSGTRYVTTDNSGIISANAFPGVTGSGNTNFLVKWTTAGSVIGNSLMQDNGTSTSINYPVQNTSQLFVYRQQITANGDGQSTIMGYRDRNSLNDGTSYGQNGCNVGVVGHSFWGDQYSFGVGGWNYNDFSRTGGVIGAEIYGAYWGALGYKSSSTAYFGVYGSSAYSNGTGKSTSASVGGIGGGFFGDFIGSTSQGSVIGQLNSGDLFAQYNKGNVYTHGKNVELVTVEEKVTPVYTISALEPNIYAKGTANLENGSTYVSFDENYAALLGEMPVITITPNGECNGVYIASVNNKGFTVKEMRQGTSNVSFSWISVGTRIDDDKMELATQIVSNPDFDRNVQQVLYSDGNLDGEALGMWWDGTTIQFGKIPANLHPARIEREEY